MTFVGYSLWAPPLYFVTCASWRVQSPTPLVDPSSSCCGCSSLASSSASHLLCPWLCPGLLWLSGPPGWLCWLLSPPSTGSPSHATGLSLVLWRTLRQTVRDKGRAGSSLKSHSHDEALRELTSTETTLRQLDLCWQVTFEKLQYIWIHQHLPGCVRWISSQLLLCGEVLEHGLGGGLDGLQSDNVVWPVSFGIYGVQ